MINGDTIDSSIHGGDGDDFAMLSGNGNASVYGDAGNDTLIGGASKDQIFGGIGDDIIQGGEGGDNIDGGDGKDQITITGGKDITITTGFNSDTIIFTADYYRSLLENTGSTGNVFNNDSIDFETPLIITDFTVADKKKKAKKLSISGNSEIAIWGNSIYTIAEGPTWEEAEANAQKLGGHLVTINDEEENDWLVSTFRDANTTYFPTGTADEDIYWMGYVRGKD